MRSIEDNSGGQQSGGGETCEQVIKYLGNCGQKTLWQWLYLQQTNENMMDKHEYRTTRN